MPTVLTIAGFDPSGGAGIIADVKTIAAFGCEPSAAITSLTFQNAQGVQGARHQSAEVVREQVVAIMAGSKVAAMKTGMLPTSEIIRGVARLIREEKLPSPVIDPVLRSTSGYALMESDAIKVLLRDLIPWARVITPNIPEAEALTGLRIESEEGMRAAASRLREMGARAALIKGGHLKQRSEVKGQKSVRGTSPTRGPQTGSPASVGAVREGSAQAIDVLDDEGNVTVFRGEWIDSPPVRGTGCMLSAAIAACLGKGIELEEAVGAAKGFVARSILNSKLQIPNTAD